MLDEKPIKLTDVNNSSKSSIQNKNGNSSSYSKGYSRSYNSGSSNNRCTNESNHSKYSGTVLNIQHIISISTS